jgi:RNA polymerase sigma-70 factor (ECF subfamily)
VTTATLAPPFVLSVPTGAPASDASVRQREDREAVLACQRGEREAFDILVERYQREIYRLCYRYVNNHADANDMAQEAFLKAYRALSSFRGESAFSTWLYRIAVNTCLNFRGARRPETAEVSDALADDAEGPLRDLEREERARQVREAVKRLPERQRATLILKIYHDLTHEEVARILGSSVGTVKANLFHALGNLRKLVDAAGGE